METMGIRDIKIENVCKEGNIVSVGNHRYAIHYNITLAMVEGDGDTLYINKEYVERFSNSDLKTIRGIDETFKKKGSNFISGNFTIKVVEFKREAEV